MPACSPATTAARCSCAVPTARAPRPGGSARHGFPAEPRSGHRTGAAPCCGVRRALVLAVVLAHRWLTARLAERMAEIDAAREDAAADRGRLRQDARARGAEAAGGGGPAAPCAAAAGAAGGAKRVEPAASAASAPAAVEEPAADARWRRPRRPGRPPPGSGEATAGAGRRPARGVVADAAAPASAAAAASAVEGFVWPKATRVSYLLTGNWRGELNGRAEVEWIKIDDRYQVNVAMHAGPEVGAAGRAADDERGPDRRRRPGAASATRRRPRS